MALDFPSNPSDGDIYGSYSYNATVGAWQAREAVSTVATVSPNKPTSAQNGDLWYDSTEGVSYLYFDDGDTAQWVELLSSGVPVITSKADKTYVDDQLALKADASDTTSALALKADASDVTSSLALKADSTTVTSGLALKANLAGGNTITGTQILSPTSSSGVPLQIKGAASQSANLQEWKNSSGTNLLSVTADGTVSSTIRIIATTPNDSGSTGGIAIKAPSGGSQPSGFLQFVNNAYNAQWASIEATSSNEMKLNASYVKIPYQPTFFAYQPESGTYQIASGKPIFTSTLVNIGSNYNTSNGRFTAPTAGVYQFSAQMLLRSGTSNGEATFFKNDANVISRNLSYSMPMGSNAHDPMHFTVFLSLAAGDFVDVRVSATVGDWYFGGGLGWFAGRLVG